MKKRKAYRPKPVINPLMCLQPADAGERSRLMSIFLTALEAMQNCRHPGEEEWRHLSDAINTVETLVLMGKLISEEVMPIVSAAIAGMVGASNRFKAGKGMRLDGPGLNAIRDVVGIYDQCLVGFTGLEMFQAQRKTQDRMSVLLRARNTEGHTVVSL